MNTTAKKMALAIGTLFVAASIAYLIYTETRETWTRPSKSEANQNHGADTAGNIDTADEKQTSDRIVRIYYFHTTYRCYSCLKIEEYTKHALHTAFGPEIRKGIIVWNPVDVDLPQNRHYIDDFHLFTKSVVLVDERKGKMVRWKILDRTWQLLRDEEAFSNYIQSEVKKYIEGA